MLLRDRQQLVLSAGAFDALEDTHHPVMERIDVTRRKKSRGYQVSLAGTHADLAIIRTLLIQIGSGAWPSTPYGRQACRRVMGLIGKATG